MDINRFYARPDREILCDLLNDAYKTSFRSTNVKPTFINGTFSSAPYYVLDDTRVEADLKIPSACLIEIAGYVGQFRCNYNRLYLNRYVPDAFIDNAQAATDTDLLNAITARYGVFLHPADVSIATYGLSPTDDPSAKIRVITPKQNHLIWVGPLTVRVVPSNHVGLEITQDHLGDLDLTGEPDLAQGIVVPDLDGLDLADLVD